MEGSIVDIESHPDVPTELVAASNTPAGAFRSVDDGQTWSWLFDSEDVVHGLTYGPQGRLVLSTAAGVRLSDDLGAEWRPVSEAPPPLARLVRAHDGVLYGVDFTEQVWRSSDGGEAWGPAGAQFSVPISAMVSARGPAGDPLLLLGTQLGVWWSSDRGDTWAQAPRRERFEDLQRTVTCASPDGECESASVADASGQLLWTLFPGDRLSLRFSGDALVLDGDPAARFQVVVDGVPVADVAAGERVSGLGEGWKEVAFVVVDAPGSGALVDAVDGFHSGAAIPWAPPLVPTPDRQADRGGSPAPVLPDALGGGCRGSAGACLPLGLGALLRQRRRRVEPPPAGRPGRRSW